MAGAPPGFAVIDPTALLSAAQLARLLGTTPEAIAGLVGSVPTRPADVRRLARRLGIDYESLRTFADDALQPLTGFDAETQLMLRLWQKLDPERRVIALGVLKDMAAAGKRRRKRKR